MRNVIGFMAGLMCGAVVGAVAALLLAPVAGSELQQQFKSSVNAMLAEGKQAAADRRTELEAQLAALKQPKAE